MENDVLALARRVQRLEALLGVSDRNPHVLDAQLDAACTTLRRQVPDEAVAALRALTLLNSVLGSRTESIDERLRLINSTVTHAEQDLAILKDHTQENRDAHIPPTFSKSDSDTVDYLVKRKSRLAIQIDEEEQAVDRLLMDFDAATARLNSSLLALAGQVRAAVPPLPSPSPTVASQPDHSTQSPSMPPHLEEGMESYSDNAPAQSPASAPAPSATSDASPVD